MTDPVKSLNGSFNVEVNDYPAKIEDYILNVFQGSVKLRNLKNWEISAGAVWKHLAGNIKNKQIDSSTFSQNSRTLLLSQKKKPLRN
jgi:hypothetical protein